MFNLPYRLEHLTSYNVTLELPPEVIGPVPEGIRVNVYLTGGKASGPKLNGQIRPVGGDWLIIRTDGVGVLDIRATLESDDGALIYAAYSGIVDLGQDGYQRFLNGELPPDGTPYCVVPRFTTADSRYQWLNRLQCVSIGEMNLSNSEVRYDVYAIRSG